MAFDCQIRLLFCCSHALCAPKESRPRFNIKMSSYQYRKSHCGDNTVVRSSYLHNGISNTGKISSLYWIRALRFGISDTRGHKRHTITSLAKYLSTAIFSQTLTVYKLSYSDGRWISTRSLKPESCHCANFVITWGTACCLYDNLQWHQQWESWHNDNSPLSVLIMCLFGCPCKVRPMTDAHWVCCAGFWPVNLFRSFRVTSLALGQSILWLPQCQWNNHEEHG